jgi:hypothetical protein
MGEERKIKKKRISSHKAVVKTHSLLFEELFQ